MHKCQPEVVLCLSVNDSPQVCIPLVNSANGMVTLKITTLLGTYIKIKEHDIENNDLKRKSTRIYNNLVLDISDVQCRGDSRDYCLL